MRWALIYASVYSALVGLIAVFIGPGPFERANTTLLSVLLVYWGGGLIAGVIVGLLLPIGRSTVGAALIGGVAGVPVACAAMLATTQPAKWVETLPVAAVLGLVLGPLFGLATKVRDRG